jgi:DNA primase
MDVHAVTTAAAATDLHLVAVAPLGTALTAEQLATLDGIGPLTDRRVIVALDNDPAGINAARTAFRLLAEAGVANPDTITLPAGHDPAQLLADHGPAALAAALTHRRPLVDLVVDDITGYWLGRITPGGWGIEEGFHALQEAAPIIARLPEPERNRQAERLADTIGFDPFTVLDTIERHVPYRAELVGELQLPQPPKLRTRTEKSATDSELSFADRLARATTGRARSAADQDTTDSELSFADRLARAMNPELDAPEHRPAEQTVAQGHDAYGPQRRPEQDHGRGHRL